MAGFEFETRLRLALREAAEREAERGRAGRAVARGRSTLVVTRRSFVPAAAAVLATVLALAVATLFLTLPGSEREAVSPPKVVARLALGESLGGTVGAYGSVWVADTGPDRLLRVDPDSRRVTVRLPVEGDVAMAPAGGTLWALNEGAPGPATDFRDLLLRIDPRSNEVAARSAVAHALRSGPRRGRRGRRSGQRLDPGHNRELAQRRLPGSDAARPSGRPPDRRLRPARRMGSSRDRAPATTGCGRLRPMTACFGTTRTRARSSRRPDWTCRRVAKIASRRPGSCNSPATLWSRARRVGWRESIRMPAGSSGVGIWEGASTRGRRRVAWYGQLSARRDPIGSSRSSPTTDEWPPAWGSMRSAPPESRRSATSCGSRRPAGRPWCCSAS